MILEINPAKLNNTELKLQFRINAPIAPHEAIQKYMDLLSKEMAKQQELLLSAQLWSENNGV